MTLMSCLPTSKNEENKVQCQVYDHFSKDYKRAIRRGLKIELLEQVMELLSMGNRCRIKTATTICPAIG